MSNYVAQSDEDRDARSTEVKSAHPYQSWMAHWTRTGGSNPGNEEDHKQKSPLYDCSELLSKHGDKRPALLTPTEIDVGSSKRVKGSGEASGHKVTDLMNEKESTSPGKLKNDTLEGQSFPMFKFSENIGSVFAIKKSEKSNHHKGMSGPQVGLDSMFDLSIGSPEKCSSSLLSWGSSRAETETREFPLPSKGVTRKSEQQIKSYKFLERNSLPGIRSLLHGPGEVDHSNAAFFVNTQKMNLSAGGAVGDPSSSNDNLRYFSCERFKKMQNTSDFEQFHGEILCKGMSKVDNLYHGSHALVRMSSSAKDVETMRICTTIDSVEELSRVLPKFSQTTHHYFVTKQTDLNLPSGGQIIRESTIATKIKGKAVSEFSLSPDFSFCAGQGVKLKPLDSSTECEGKENIENAKKFAADLKNESSAETDTVEINAFPEKHLLGDASSLSNKEIKVGKKSSMNRELPDMNQEFTLLPVAPTSTDDGEPSTSRTQSLDVENFLAKAEDQTNSKSVASSDVATVDPFTRWVERLKPSASHPFVYGTKTAMMGDDSSCEKVNELFSKILKCSKSSSEPKTSKSCAMELMTIDPTAKLQKSPKSSSSDSVRRSQEVTLSLGWIRRWCHKQVACPTKKQEYMDISEPHNSKPVLSDTEKKQFPSIGAMALMGKVMNGFPPCEFRKRGGFVVWNTSKG